ncbi:hypothetical protein [Nocardiopsis alborubida]|uniref:Uncharacterized protein n=1 Tax=Nocardiopsis alborubida TaxID=146802 RepID=A0A7X6MIS9_9ACTN|nr:hypothetical protein [Nocardiopsis alborubida]NKZ02112.1 hypothetical protein [Nocardiopsis alborubida]
MGDDVTEFDQTSTEDLRDRAVELARQRWDLRFFWRLLRLIPAAEAAAGNEEASEASVAQLSGFVYEALSAEADPEVQEALRPVYVQYLLDHGETAEDVPGNEDAGATGVRGGTNGATSTAEGPVPGTDDPGSPPAPGTRDDRGGAL